MLNDKCQNEKVPSLLLRLGTFVSSKELPLASALYRAKSLWVIMLIILKLNLINFLTVSFMPRISRLVKIKNKTENFRHT